MSSFIPTKIDIHECTHTHTHTHTHRYIYTQKQHLSRSVLVLVLSLYNFTCVGVSVPAVSTQVPNSHFALKHTNTHRWQPSFQLLYIIWSDNIPLQPYISYWSPTQKPSVNTVYTFPYAITHTHTQKHTITHTLRGASAKTQQVYLTWMFLCSL